MIYKDAIDLEIRCRRHCLGVWVYVLHVLICSWFDPKILGGRDCLISLQESIVPGTQNTVGGRVHGIDGCSEFKLNMLV